MDLLCGHTVKCEQPLNTHCIRGGEEGRLLDLWTTLLSQTRLVTACFQGGWVRGGWSIKALSLIIALEIDNSVFFAKFNQT